MYGLSCVCNSLYVMCACVSILPHVGGGGEYCTHQALTIKVLFLHVSQTKYQALPTITLSILMLCLGVGDETT